MHKKVQVAIIEILKAQSRALLLQTNNERGGFWQNVTGSVENLDHNSNSDEFLNAAQREIREETSLEVARDHIFPLDLQYNFKDRWNRDVLEKTFACLIFEKVHDISIDPSEHQSFRWVDVNNWDDRFFKYPSNAEVMKKAIQFSKKFMIVFFILIFSPKSFSIDNIEDVDHLNDLNEELIKNEHSLNQDEVKAFEELYRYDFHKGNTQTHQPSEEEGPNNKNISSYDPTVFKAVIKSNSLVTNLKNKKKFTLRAPQLVFAKVKDADQLWAIILNEKQVVLYETALSNIQSVEADFDLLPKPTHFSESEQKINKFQFDKNLKTQYQFSLGKEYIRSPFVTDILESDDKLLSNSRFDFRLYFPWAASFSFGPVISLTSGNWRSQFLGVGISHLKDLSNDWSLRARLEVQKSLSHKAIAYDSDHQATFDSATSELSLDFLRKFTWATLSAEFSYKVIYLELEDYTTESEINSGNKSSTGWHIAIGYTFNYEYKN